IAVVISNKPYRLKPSDTSSILYTGNVPSSPSLLSQEYYYAVIDNDGNIMEREPFTRSHQFHPNQEENSPNDFFNRTWTTKPVRQTPLILPPNHNSFPSDLHPTDEIPTFHFQANQHEIDNMHKNNLDEELHVMGTMTYIRHNVVKPFPNVRVKLGGRTARHAPKYSYNIKIDDSDEDEMDASKQLLYGCSRFKLRAIGNSDPAYIREYLAYKTLVSMGVPTTDVSFARVFINQQPMGLYIMIEHYQPSWLRMVFGNGDPNYKHGSLFFALKLPPVTYPENHFSNLEYYPDNKTTYTLGQYEIKEEPSDKKLGYEPLIEFTKFIHDVGSDDITAWNNKLDVDGFIRSMVHEFFAGLSDNMIFDFGNYFLYQDPSQNNQFTYMNVDLDNSLGRTTQQPMDQLLKGDFQSFALERKGQPPSPLITKILEKPKFLDQINKLVRKLNVQLFNLEVLGPIIDDVLVLIQDDVAWDKTLPKPGKKITAPHLNNYGEDPENLKRINERKKDSFSIIQSDMSLEQAVNGPIEGHISTISIKEWIKRKNEAVTMVLHNK
ncbi:coth protein-domain-containing protein, partial [Phascolomyces articulosus]